MTTPPPFPDMHTVVGSCNVLFVTFDCLRYDVAQATFREGRSPTLATVLPAKGWEPRDTPATFTLPAHMAFFHGFLPTPQGPGPHPRPLALAFEGSLTTVPETYVFPDVPNILEGFRRRGYRTCCVGGVGFFNLQTPLSRILPSYFETSYWNERMGVANPESTKHQVQQAREWLDTLDPFQKVFLFINISATHEPTRHYVPNAQEESPQTQAAALSYADSQLKPLFQALRHRGRCYAYLMADHGEAMGEDGLWGHRLAHPTVTTIPYAEGFL